MVQWQIAGREDMPCGWRHLALCVGVGDRQAKQKIHRRQATGSSAVTNARRAGSIWTASVARRCRRTRALFVALPLLLLSVLADHGLAASGEPSPATRLDRAADLAGTEGKAQLPVRSSALTDPLRAKAKLSGDTDGMPKALTAQAAEPPRRAARGSAWTAAAERSPPATPLVPRSRAPPATA